MNGKMESSLRAALDDFEALQASLSAQQEAFTEAHKDMMEKMAAHEAAEKEACAKLTQCKIDLANARADLKIAQAAIAAAKEMHAKHEAHMKEMKEKMESVRKVNQELTINVATEERLRVAAEKNGGKTATVAAPAMPPMRYEVEGFRRDSNGDLRSFSLVPKKSH